MDILKIEVSPELREAMQRFADAIGDVAKTGKAIGEHVGRMFPDGYPKMSKGFDIAAGGPQLVDVPRGISAELLDPVVIEVANDA